RVETHSLGLRHEQGPQSLFARAVKIPTPLLRGQRNERQRYPSIMFVEVSELCLVFNDPPSDPDRAQAIGEQAIESRQDTVGACRFVPATLRRPVHRGA